LVAAGHDLWTEIEARGVVEEVHAEVLAVQVEVRLDTRGVGQPGKVSRAFGRAARLRRGPVTGFQSYGRRDRGRDQQAPNTKSERRQQTNGDAPVQTGQRERRVQQQREC